jgi:hypothetical protein
MGLLLDWILLKYILSENGKRENKYSSGLVVVLERIPVWIRIYSDIGC